MNDSSLVLVTGSAGRVGQAVVAELQARGHSVRGFDRAPTPRLPDALVGDLTDAACVQEAVTGVGTVIHLAAAPDDDDFFTQLLPNNLTGLYHVMEAARAAGVRRVILPSSGQVNWWRNLQGPWPIHPDDPVTPRYWYAATKMFMEAIGRGYAEMHGMSVIVARLGWCPRTLAQVAEISASEWAQDVYLSPGDAGRFFADAVEAKDVRFAILYAASRAVNTVRFDLEPTRRALGWEPHESWPAGVDVVTK